MSSSSSRPRERSSEAKAQRQKKKRCGSSNRESKDERRLIRKSKSPMRAPVFFKPRLNRHFIKPRYKREDHAFRKPGFSFRFRRYRSVSVERSHRTLPPKNTSSPSPGSKSDLKKDNKCSKGTSKDQNDVQKSFKSKSREKELEIFSIKVTEDGLSNTELPPSVMRAALRNRAIQQKRREIEEVYRQDCDTFGIVAKMLIAKDPSLEQSIQSSLQANLKEIGQRCVEAMQNFIDEYDSKYPSPCIPPQC